ncbi:MAG: YceI family protein [Chloroflexota bacterium]
MKPISIRPFLLPALILIIAIIGAGCAIPIAQPAQQAGPAEEPAAVEASSAEEAIEEEAAEEISAEATEEPAEEPAETSAESSADEAGDSTAGTFTILPDQSEARFYIDEELRGNPVTVIGVSSSLNGEIMIDPANPASTQIGAITIDAASFVTDSDRRNGAIRRFVLNSGSYPNITFVPTSIDGLPESAVPGDMLVFQVTGDLTIKDQTRSETFTVSVTADSETQINGSASTIIMYADYGIIIPDVPFIANVGDELTLEFDFVAVQ